MWCDEQERSSAALGEVARFEGMGSLFQNFDFIFTDTR